MDDLPGDSGQQAGGRQAGGQSLSPRRRVVVVLFDRFELLDVFGPLELLGILPEHFEISLVGSELGPIPSDQGPRVIAEHSYGDAPQPDIVLVPGGIGTRALARDQAFCRWLSTWAAQAELVTSVCTGAGLLAACGLLDGYRATSNKASFAWVRQQGPLVDWVVEARWVEDRNRWTSSGVAAGMDMTLALIARLHSPALAHEVADKVELEWHKDASWDPFAAKNGLVPG